MQAEKAKKTIEMASTSHNTKTWEKITHLNLNNSNSSLF